MGMWGDLFGTTKAYFRLGLTGVRLADSSGNLLVRNAAGNADAAITASTVNISGEILTVNSDAAGSGADWKYTIQRPAAGMGAAVTLTLPVDDGTAAQVLATDGNGVLSWASAASTALCNKVNHTHLVKTDSATIAMFTTGAADVINCIEVMVDIAFDGSGPVPNMSIGVAGTTSKYSATTDVDLTAVGVYQIHPGLDAGGAEPLIITFAKAASPTTGAARVQVYYATPA